MTALSSGWESVPLVAMVSERHWMKALMMLVLHRNGSGLAR